MPGDVGALMEAARPGLAWLARVLLAALFLDSAWTKARHWRAGLQEVRALGLPWPAPTLAATVTLQATGAVLLLLGWQVQAAALALAAFTLLATVLGHAWWRPGRSGERIRFLEHLAIVGGLLSVSAYA